jgi:hypothetical protein
MSLVKRIDESRGNAHVVTQGSKVRIGNEPVSKYLGLVWYDETTYTNPVYRLWDGTEWINLAQKLCSRTTLLAVDIPVSI